MVETRFPVAGTSDNFCGRKCLQALRAESPIMVILGTGACCERHVTGESPTGLRLAEQKAFDRSIRLLLRRAAIAEDSLKGSEIRFSHSLEWERARWDLSTVLDTFSGPNPWQVVVSGTPRLEPTTYLLDHLSPYFTRKLLAKISAISPHRFYLGTSPQQRRRIFDAGRSIDV